MTFSFHKYEVAWAQSITIEIDSKLPMGQEVIVFSTKSSPSFYSCQERD